MDNVQLYIPDSLLPTDNELEIPMLDASMQATSCDIPFCMWGEQARTKDMLGQGTLHFYCDDYKFNTIYDHPSMILQKHPRNIVEPNYSLFAETPIAFGLQAIYKKRWIARAMQDRGIRVFVDLNVNQKFYKMNLIGVPKGWRAFCTRGYDDRLNNLEYEYGIAQLIAGDERPLFVVYAGGDKVKAFCREHGLIHVSSLVTTKSKQGAFKQIEEQIAFMGGSEIITKQLKDIPQLEDFSKVALKQ